jgi:hypothetical protein
LGVIRSQRWFINGELHWTDGPAVILTSTSGSLESEAWFIRNERDRGGKYPVFIDYDTKGKPRTIGYREEADDMLPYFTVRFFFPDGSLKAEAWGVEKIFARNHSVDERDLHRLSGPAYITYDENGNITDAIWRRHGEVDEDYFTEHKIMSWQMKMRKQQVLLTNLLAGTVGKSYDQALTECVIGLFKAEPINQICLWKSKHKVAWPLN